MTDHHFPLDDIKDIAEEVMHDKRDETGDEARARDGYDLSGNASPTGPRDGGQRSDA